MRSAWAPSFVMAAAVAMETGKKPRVDADRILFCFDIPSLFSGKTFQAYFSGSECGPRRGKDS